jgi:hypothetical protein
MPGRGFNEKLNTKYKNYGINCDMDTFVLTMSLGVIGEGLDTFNYVLYGFTMLYITYILNNSKLKMGALTLKAFLLNFEDGTLRNLRVLTQQTDLVLTQEFI